MRVALLPALAALAAPPASAQDSADTLRAARRLVERGEYARALPLLDRRLAKDPRDRDSLRLRLQCRAWLNQLDEGIADGDTLVEVAPEDAVGYRYRGYCRHAKLEVEAARADYEKAIELDPEDAYTHYLLATLLTATDAPRQAMTHYERAIALQPNDPAYRLEHGNAAYAVADFEAARQSLSEALRLDPSSTWPFPMIADAEWQCGLDDAAMRTMQQYVMKTRDYQALVDKGRMAWKLTRERTAATEFEKVIARGEQQQALEARRCRAMLHLARGEYGAMTALLTNGPAETSAFRSFELALLRWCAARATGVDDADVALATALEQHGEQLVWAADAVALCVEPPPLRDPVRTDVAGFACMHTFVAAFRALVEGDERRADRMLLRCVNTGQDQMDWWLMAKSMLLRRHGADAFQRTFGATFEAAEHDGRLALRVLAVDAASHATVGGLQQGDLITHVAGLPVAVDWPTEAASRPCGGRFRVALLRDGMTLYISLPVCWYRETD